MQPAPPPQSVPPLSAVVVTYRSGGTLAGALSALRASAPAGTELLVIENGGDAAVAGVVREHWPDARVTVNDANRGFAAAVNQGLAQASAPAVLLLNPDAEVEPGAIPALLAALDSLPDAGIVAPRLLAEDGQPALSCYPFLSPAMVAWRHLQIGRVLPNVVSGAYRHSTLDLARQDPVRVDWAQGACLLIRRALLTELGGLNERFFLYAEEVDLARRARSAGWRTYLIPTARVRHAEGTSSGQVVPLKLASHYLSKAIYAEKHLSAGNRTAVRAILLLDLGLRMAYRAFGVVRGQPPDAGQRLKAYAWTAHVLLTQSPDGIVAAWRRLGQRA